MNRRTLLAGLASAAAVMAAAPAFALSYAEDVVIQLTKLGFLDIHVETTLLGRVKIVAARADGIREIVLNPRTGEILRDVWTPSSGGSVRAVLADVEDDGDADGDDVSGSDDDEDKGDDDNSGSGSGKDDDDKDDDNSGSGNGGEDRNDDRDDRDDRNDRDDDKKDD